MNYEKKAKELRQEILKSLFACQSGHPGGSLSCVEILMALYYDEMKNLILRILRKQTETVSY